MLVLSRWLCLSVLLAGAWTAAAGEDAQPVTPPETKSEAKAETPAPATQDGAVERPKDGASAKPAGSGQFPIQSEFFQYVLDNQAEDEREAQQIELNSMKAILEALKGATEEQLVASIDTKATYRELMLRAEKYRGHVVRIRGSLKFSEVPKHISEEVGVQVYQGQISNMMGEIVTFISLSPPDVGTDFPVRLTGVFLKRYAYLNRLEGEKLTWTPLVFVKRVEPWAEDQERPKTNPRTYLLMGVVLFVFMAWFVFRVSRYSPQKIVKNNPFSRKKRELDEKKKG